MRMGLACANDLGAFFAQAALVAAVAAVKLLFFFAPGQLDLGGIDNDDMVAGVDKGSVGGFVLPLKQPGRESGDPAEHLPVGIDHVPTAVDCFWRGYIRPHETLDPSIVWDWRLGKPAQR